MRPSMFVAGAAAAVLLAAGCGSAKISDSPTSTPPASSAAAQASPTTAIPVTAPPTTVALAHVGATITVSMQAPGDEDAKANVTLVKVTDPAQATDYETPDAGKRFLAVQFSIAAVGAISDDANSDASVIGSDDQAYTPDFDSLAGCTNFATGEVNLMAGQTLAGCVAFELPNGVSASKVDFGTEEGTIGQWLVP